MKAILQLRAIGADVLNRCGADTARYQRQILQPAPALRQRPLHEAVPGLAGSGAHIDRIRICADDIDAFDHHMQDQAGKIAGQHDIAAAAQYQL